METEQSQKIEVQRSDETTPAWRRLLSSLTTLGIIGIAILLWPAPLGGSTRLVVVSGNSMEPTYDLGDMVVTRGGDDTRIGDAVVFAVPEGESGAGILVIHRVIGLDDDGFFVTQGDNRDTPDRWQIAQSDIVGEPLVHIPEGGHVVYFLQQWPVLAVLVGLLTIFLLWPADKVADDDEIDDDVGAELGPDVPIGSGSLPEDGWTSIVIDEAVMAEAEAWLEEQLQTMLPTNVR